MVFERKVLLEIFGLVNFYQVLERSDKPGAQKFI